MQASWSQPVAEAVVFSNDFASRHDHRAHRQPGHVDRHDALGTHGAADDSLPAAICTTGTP